MPITGAGFTPGQDYQFSATVGSLESDTLTADQYGQLTATLDVPSDAGPATGITVTAAAADAPDIAVATLQLYRFGSSAVSVPLGPVNSAPEAYPPNSQLVLLSSCFQPGEGVALSSPQLSLGPAKVGKYLPDGEAYIFATVLAVHATGMATVTVTGSVSGHQAATKISTGGNVLDAGSELQNTGQGQLISASGAYRMLMNWNGIYVCHFPPVQPQTTFCDEGWSTPFVQVWYEQPTTLQLRSDGDLVLLSGSQPIWSTGTVGAGNQLTMRDDGNLALTSSRGDLLWSSNTGLVHGAAGAVTAAYIAGSRSGRVVYVNGLIKQWAGAGQLVRSPHRLVYLQRYLNRWLAEHACSNHRQRRPARGRVRPVPRIPVPVGCRWLDRPHRGLQRDPGALRRCATTRTSWSTIPTESSLADSPCSARRCRLLRTTCPSWLVTKS